MSEIAPLKTGKEMPKPLPLRKLIGPSFIILGMGLGSGELILWPYLSSNFGLGIIWAAVLGITFQFFMNMEIERYTLVRGESVFVGLRRKYGKTSPYWFILTTLIPWMWPGIIASCGAVLASMLGIKYSGIIGITLLVLQGLMFSTGKVIYKTEEKLQKAIILIGVPFVFLVTFFFTKAPDWQALGQGLIGKGDGYWFLPAGIPVATFLGALAYAGAGGNLNLAQSFYIKEKGYGMGRYAGKITSIFKKSNENIELEGYKLQTSKVNIDRFKKWWKIINTEHAIVFWAAGALTMILLSLLAYSTVFGDTGIEKSITFVIKESHIIGSVFPFLGKFFLIVAAAMLFGTQFSVMGSNARISAENLIISNKERFPSNNLSKYFFIFLWIQIALGIAIFAIGFTEPLQLVVTSAVMNAISMFIYSGLVLWMNLTKLEKPFRPKLVRIIAVGCAFLFYGGFSVFTIIDRIF